MAFTVKQWLNKVGSGTLLDAPDVNSETHLEAASLRDMETRLSSYTDSQAGVTIVVTLPGDPTPNPTVYPEGTIWIRRAA
jgi:hypothetical protein